MNCHACHAELEGEARWGTCEACKAAGVPPPLTPSEEAAFLDLVRSREALLEHPKVKPLRFGGPLSEGGRGAIDDWLKRGCPAPPNSRPYPLPDLELRLPGRPPVLLRNVRIESMKASESSLEPEAEPEGIMVVGEVALPVFEIKIRQSGVEAEEALLVESEEDPDA